MLNNLKIQEKLWLGFGAIMLLMVALAAFTLTEIAVIQSEFDDLMNDRYPKAVLANTVIKQTLDNRWIFRSALYSDDSNEIERLIERAEANRKANTEAFRKIESTLVTEKGKEKFAAIVVARKHVGTKYDKLYPLLRTKNPAETLPFLNNEFTPASDAFLALVEDFAKSVADYMDQGRSKATASIATIRTTMIVCIVLALLFGMVIAVMLSRLLSRQINEAVRRSEKIAQGDFTANVSSRAMPTLRTEIGRLLAAQEEMRTGLVHALEEIRHSANQVDNSASELASATEEVASNVQRQADSTTSASATLEELSVSIDQVADSTRDAAGQATRADELAQQGALTVADSVGVIQGVSHSVQLTYTEMAALQAEVSQIGSIVTVIREVADQTNLLALNAAIEAARAGESGRGFAVVADEVRKLAERTTSSAHEITQMVHSIQENAGRVVTSMQGNQQNVSSMTESADRTSQAIRSVQQSAQEVLGSIATINGALSEQRISGQELAKTMETVAQMAERNCTTVEELSSTSHGLKDLSANLQTIVARFRW